MRGARPGAHEARGSLRGVVPHPVGMGMSVSHGHRSLSVCSSVYQARDSLYRGAVRGV